MDEVPVGWIPNQDVRKILVSVRRPASRGHVKALARGGAFRYAYYGKRPDWYFWREDVEKYATDGVRVRFAGWSPDDEWSLSVTDTSATASGTVETVDTVDTPSATAKLLGENDQLKRDLKTAQGEARYWQDAWANQQQADEHRRAADEALLRARRNFGEGDKELVAVDEHRLQEINHLKEVIAALRIRVEGQSGR